MGYKELFIERGWDNVGHKEGIRVNTFCHWFTKQKVQCTGLCLVIILFKYMSTDINIKHNSNVMTLIYIP